jgi:hypothetical protein
VLSIAPCVTPAAASQSDRARTSASAKVRRVTLYAKDHGAHLTLLEYDNDGWQRRWPQRIHAMAPGGSDAPEDAALAFSLARLGFYRLVDGDTPILPGSSRLLREPSASQLLGGGLPRALLPWRWSVLLSREAGACHAGCTGDNACGRDDMAWSAILLLSSQGLLLALFSFFAFFNYLYGLASLWKPRIRRTYPSGRTIAVVIVAFNERYVLEETVRACDALTYSNKLIVLADDSTDPQTVDRLR